MLIKLKYKNQEATNRTMGPLVKLVRSVIIDSGKGYGACAYDKDNNNLLIFMGGSLDACRFICRALTTVSRDLKDDSPFDLVKPNGEDRDVATRIALDVKIHQANAARN